jgi:hypothetical protein
LPLSHLSPVAFILQFKPKNFAKAEQAPVPETKLAEPIPADARRSNRNNRPPRGGGRGGANRGGGGDRGAGRVNYYESEVVFGGIVGAGAIGQTETRNRKAADPDYEPEIPSSAPDAATTTAPAKSTKRLVKASGAAVAGEGTGPIAGISKPKKRNQAVKSESESGFSSCSSSDEDDDEDALAIDDEDEYLPTLLASLGRRDGVSGKKSARSAAAAAANAVPEELMARPPEDESELNKQLTWLTEQNLEDAGLVLFQLPSVLPIPVPHQSNGGAYTTGVDGAIDLTNGAEKGSNGASTSAAAAAAAAAKAAEGRPASLAELPPGKIGKLLVLRNGSVKMQIGEVLFDVSPGIPCQMLQEFAAVDPSTKTITMLGEIEKRIVVTPNIDTLLSEDPLPEWKYANTSGAGRGDAAGGSGAVNGRGGLAAAAPGKKKKGGGGRAVIIESSDEDEEMVDADKGKKDNVVDMVEEDEEETEDEEEEPKKKSRPAPKARSNTKTARK